jgi:hypothetical protein
MLACNPFAKSSCRVLLLIMLLLAGCSSVHTGVKGVFETATMPLKILAGKTPYPETRASMQIQTAYDRMAEWEKVKASGDIGMILAFLGNGSDFRIDWVPVRDVIPQTRVKLINAERSYDYFLSQLREALQFKRIYENAAGSSRDEDIAALVRFAKANPSYSAALNEPPIRDRHEQAIFELAKSSNTPARYDEFIAWYPDSVHAVEAGRLREQATFKNARQEDTAEAYDGYLREYPDGIHAADIRRLREDVLYEHARRENTSEAYHAYLRDYPQGRYASEVRPAREAGIFAQTRKEDSTRAYDAYLKEYPNGAHAAEATALLQNAKAREVHYTKVMDNIVARDSLGWVTNRYDPDSMSNVTVLARSPDGAPLRLRGNYTYNNGFSGWVEAEFADGKLNCLRFHDFADTCRPLRQPIPREQFARAANQTNRRNHSRSDCTWERRSCENNCQGPFSFPGFIGAIEGGSGMFEGLAMGDCQRDCSRAYETCINRGE